MKFKILIKTKYLNHTQHINIKLFSLTTVTVSRISVHDTGHFSSNIFIYLR